VRSLPYVLDIPLSPAGVPVVRAWARHTLIGTTADVAADALVMVGELMAVLVRDADHETSPAVHIEIVVRPAFARIALTCHGIPERASTWTEEEHDAAGYGLHLINALAHSWRSEISDGTQRAWAHVPPTPDHDQHDQPSAPVPPPPIPAREPPLRTSDVAAWLNVSRATILDWAGLGIIPCTQIPGGDIRFHRSPIEAALADHGTPAPAWPWDDR
jgi:excisionase family DNA binding protein